MDITGSNGARPRVRMTGSVGQVRAGVPGGPPMLRAELADGRDAVTVIWLGRNQITGIEPGRSLSVEGTLSLRRGRPVIYNPRYELGQGPATGERGSRPPRGSGGLFPRNSTAPRAGGSVPG